MAGPDRDRLIALVQRRGVITARDAARAGIHSQQLTRLVAEGIVERIARAQYRFADHPVTEHHALVVVSRAVPKGVICLLSALNFHGIGTQLPPEVWIAVQRGARTPRTGALPVRVVHFSEPAFSEGIETHRIEGESVRVYSIAKTLADLFKCRNKVGLGVAIEVLREAWEGRKFTIDALDHAARACRVERVIRPYVEAMVA